MQNTDLSPSPLEEWSDSAFVDGFQLFIKRDDLLPFPLAGNKVRKLSYELADVDLRTATILTVGAITSNHCRTAALLAARGGGSAHLILHGDVRAKSAEITFDMLTRLGATWDVVALDGIRRAVDEAQRSIPGEVHFITGGCHTPAGVDAYADAVEELASQLDAAPDCIILPSGTGATQAGIIAGCHALGWTSTRVVGVSVARDTHRGVESIREALSWRGLAEAEVEFLDNYRAGGYALVDDRTRTARDTGWRYGLPLDGTYTAKAFSALLDRAGSAADSDNVVFWHTGGFNTQTMMDIDSA